LPALLTKRGISFCVRVEKAGNGGFACVRDFLRSGLNEQVVELRAPDHHDAVDYECDRQPTTVRLVRHVASTGKIRVLMTNLFDAVRFPATIIGDLYHQRWRIEEAFKRLKHRLALEHVTGCRNWPSHRISPPRSCATTSIRCSVRQLMSWRNCRANAVSIAPSLSQPCAPCFLCCLAAPPRNNSPTHLTCWRGVPTCIAQPKHSLAQRDPSPTSSWR